MSNKLSPPRPLVPACPVGYKRLHLTSEPEGKDAYRPEPRQETLFVLESDVSQFLNLVAKVGGLHHGFRHDNTTLLDLMEEQGIVVFEASWNDGDQLEVWGG